MSEIIARSQITVADLKDGKSAQLVLSGNYAYVQQYSLFTKLYSPDYTKKPFIVTPEVYFTGSKENCISRVTLPKWTINGKDIVEYGGVMQNQSPYSLTINNNLSTASQLIIEFSCNITDADTNKVLVLKNSICITKTTLEAQTPIAIIDTPNGNLFKNEIFSELSAICRLMVGAVRMDLRTTYKWSRLVNGQYQEFVDDAFLKGQDTNTLTVHADFVGREESFRCEVTYENNVYREYVSFLKRDDPYMMRVTSKNGDKMKNGEGVILCEAHVSRGDVDIPDSNAEKRFLFNWKKYNKLTGQQDTSWRNPTTRAIELTKDDIDSLSTFICEMKELNNSFIYKLPFTL